MYTNEDSLRQEDRIRWCGLSLFRISERRLYDAIAISHKAPLALVKDLLFHVVAAAVILVFADLI